jgi:hypothetical protein
MLFLGAIRKIIFKGLCREIFHLKHASTLCHLEDHKLLHDVDINKLMFVFILVNSTFFKIKRQLMQVKS